MKEKLQVVIVMKHKQCRLNAYVQDALQHKQAAIFKLHRVQFDVFFGFRWRQVQIRNGQCLHLPPMENMNIVFFGIRPYIKFYHSHTSLKCVYDGDVAAIAVELIPDKVRIVTSKYEIMRQRSIHVMLYLKPRK